MSEQPEALRLADELDKTSDFQSRAWAASSELRRLNEEVTEQARLLGMGAERELSLLAKIDRLEKQLGEAVWNYGEKVRANQELLEALKQALGYVEEEAENAQRLYGQYPPRQARIQGLKDDARKHMDAIAAIRSALAEQPARQPICGLDVYLDPNDGLKPKLFPKQPAQPCTYPNCPYPCPDLPDCRDAEKPAGWFESPHGEFRANPLHKMEFPSSLVDWKIPLYTHPVREADDDLTIAYMSGLHRGKELARSEQPAQQEPVAWANPNDLQNFDMKVRTNGGPLHTVPLYTSPQPAQPTKPLTNAQIAAVAAEIWGSMLIAPQSYKEFARAIEAAHGIKEGA